MNVHSCLLSTCVLMAASGAASAAQVPPVGEVEIIDLAPWTRTWPTGVTASTAGRAVAGDFTGDLTPDVWQRTADTLVLYMNPSYMDHSLELSVATSSIACMPGATAAAKDRLVIATSTGLSLVEFTLGASPELSTTSLGFSSWANAKSIACCRLDLDAHPDLMGISSDGTKLLRLISDGQGGYTAAADRNLGSGAFEAIPVMYLTNEAIQIAVLTPTWMFVMRQNGERVKLAATTSSFGHIARVSQAGQADCVAWLQEIAGGNGERQVRVIANEAEEQDPMELDTIEATAIVAGDVDADGSDDLGLLTETDHAFHTFLNQRDAEEPAADRFVVTEGHGISLAGNDPPGSPNPSTPVLADLNFDLKADLFALETDSVQPLMVLRDPPPFPEVEGFKMMGTDSGHPCFHRGDFYSASFFTQNCQPPTSSDPGVLMLHVKDPWGLTASTIPAGWELELVMWQQVGGEPQPGVTPLAVERYLYDISGDGTNIYRAAASYGATWGFPVRIETNATLFEQKYYIVLRPVPPNEGEPLTEYVIGFTSEDSDSSGTYHGPMAHLLALAGAWPASIPYDLHDNGPGCFYIARQKTGGAVPLLRVPRYSGTPSSGNQVTPPAPVAQ